MIISGYEYGYDSGSGSFLKQSGSEANEVNGHFAYPAANGQLIDIKYTAGIDGYVPYTVNAPKTSTAATSSYGSAIANSGPISPSAESYAYSYKTNHGSQPIHKESEGSYSYTNNYGAGSSATVNSNNGYAYNVHASHSKPATKTNSWTVKQYQSNDDDNSQQQSGDASYKFDYNNGDSSRQEASDATGNIHGQYSYINEAGQHDLKYIAGAETGFVVTGGSLAIPNGIDNGEKVRQLQGTSSTTTHAVKSNQWNHSSDSDGSFSYSYNTGSSSKPSHSNAEYVNTSGWKTKNFDSPVVVYNVEDINSNSNGQSWSDESTGHDGGDASYQFAYNAGDSARQEVASNDGSVTGQYSFTNEAGQHDFHYHAGAGTGFVVTGGSLSVPNGIDSGATVRQLTGTSDFNTEWAAPQTHQHISHGTDDSVAHVYHSDQVSSDRNGQYKLEYQVGGSGLQRNGDGGPFTLTKLLPIAGNSKFGYILDSAKEN